MITREDKFNTSVIGINAVLKHIESKPETMYCGQLDEQKNIIRWDYLSSEGLKSVTVVVKASTTTYNYSCNVYNEDRMVPYPVCLKLVKEGFVPDYVAFINVKNGWCNLIKGKELRRFIDSKQAFTYRCIESKSVSGEQRNDKLALVPMEIIKKEVGCINRRLF